MADGIISKIGSTVGKIPFTSLFFVLFGLFCFLVAGNVIILWEDQAKKNDKDITTAVAVVGVFSFLIGVSPVFL